MKDKFIEGAISLAAIGTVGWFGDWWLGAVTGAFGLYMFSQGWKKSVTRS